MLTLEEIERLAVDLYIKDRSDDVSSICLDSAVCSKRVYIAMKYDEYVNTFTSTDKRRLYMFGYIQMATKFRNYWTDV